MGATRASRGRAGSPRACWTTEEECEEEEEEDPGGVAAGCLLSCLSWHPLSSWHRSPAGSSPLTTTAVAHQPQQVEYCFASSCQVIISSSRFPFPKLTALVGPIPLPASTSPHVTVVVVVVASCRLLLFKKVLCCSPPICSSVLPAPPLPHQWWPHAFTASLLPRAPSSACSSQSPGSSARSAACSTPWAAPPPPWK